jgi:hypothetical protein
MIGGYQSTQLIHAAARLGVADHLRDGPRRSEELAPLVGAQPAGLRRLMRALAALDVLREREDGQFELTPMGRYLQEDLPGSLRAAALCHGGPFYAAWGALLHGVERGEMPFERVYGAPMFAYFGEHQDRGGEFDRFMTGVSTAIIAAAVASYDFSDAHRVVDVAGGHGTLLTAILEGNPHLAGVLFDLPPVIAGARPRIEAAGYAGRCTLVTGDFFEAVPESGDLYLLKWILHDWDDDRARRILTNCRRAMDENARLLLIEEVQPERIAAGDLGALRDILMMVLTGGQERTEAEYRALLDAAGFELTRVIPLDGAAASPVSGARMSLLEAQPR